MKKITIFISAVILIAIAVFACVSNTPDVEGYKGIEPYEQVGIQHNQGLDSIFGELMSERIRLFKESKNQPLTKSVSNHGFPATYNFNALIQNTTKRLTKTWYPEVNDEFLDAAMSKQNFDVRTRASSADRKSEIMAMLTPFQQEYYSRMLKILDRSIQKNVKRFVADIISLEKEIVEKAPSKEEAAILLITTSVARNSAEYWAANINKWADMLNNEIVAVYDANSEITKADPIKTTKPNGYYAHPYDPSKYFLVIDGLAHEFQCPGTLIFNPTICVCDYPSSYDWGEVVKSDVGGAVTGAIGGALGGAAAGGAGAVPGAIIGGAGGAIFASGKSAVSELWDYLFD